MGCKASKPEASVLPSTSQQTTATGTPPPLPAGTLRSQSKTAVPTKKTARFSSKKQKQPLQPKDTATSTSPAQPSPRTTTTTDHHHQPDRLYRLLVRASTSPDDISLLQSLDKAMTPTACAYQNPNTNSTPLHVAVRLLDNYTGTNTGDGQGQADTQASLCHIIQSLIKMHPAALHIPDASGHIPLHYAISASRNDGMMRATAAAASSTTSVWDSRAAIVRLLLQAAQHQTTTNSQSAVMSSMTDDYMHRNNVVFDDTTKGGCSPLYRALQTIPDDFYHDGPTVRFIETMMQYYNTTAAAATKPESTAADNNNNSNNMVSVGNASDGDKPLALLYRRFTRQFDLAEKFFSGDNSRPEVVQHRLQYKTAAGNTWKVIETLLRNNNNTIPTTPSASSKSKNNRNNSSHDEYSYDEDEPFRTVHRAVQVETPPDLLRYIVETHPDELAIPDETGKLPLHHAAMFKPRVYHTTTGSSSSNANADQQQVSYPPLYSKYVIDELLYKYPDAAVKQDHDGNFPLTLAAMAGKQWIGGGIKSLYDAYPEAVEQLDLAQHDSLREALSSLEMEQQQNAVITSSSKEEKIPDGIIHDEQHDAIMLVQQPGVHVSQVVTSMWAHEEDAGVQMLGCVAIRKMVDAACRRSSREQQRDEQAIIQIALSAVPAVVNAMKAHPNEVVVQEKACDALLGLAPADGHAEISFVALGAVAAIVGAMQAHVSDAGVQQGAAGAIAEIIRHGGDDRATIVASVSGLTALVNALAAHPFHGGVQAAGCCALKELTELEHSANLPALPQSQADPLLEAARQRFPVECSENVAILLSRTAATNEL